MDKIGDFSFNCADINSEEQVDEIIDLFIEDNSSFIRKLSIRSTNSKTDFNPNLTNRAFISQCKIELKKATENYVFNKKHWEDPSRRLVPFLKTTVKNVSFTMNLIGRNLSSVPVCPACKFFGEKSVLRSSQKSLICDYCNNRITELEKFSLKDEAAILELSMRKVFNSHSRKGGKCNGCSRFIPESHYGDNCISCPYVDCDWFGDSVEKYSHPSGRIDYLVSESNFWKDENSAFNSSFIERTPSEDINPLQILEVKSDINNELTILNEVVNTQLNNISRFENNLRTSQRIFMYNAYQSLINECPDDMVRYLVHGFACQDNPIQSRIFQEFIRILENNLPLKVRDKEIYDLGDPRMHLFLGISNYEGIVGEDLIVPNNTKERYVGRRKMKDFGPCYIGHLLDIKDVSTGQSIIQSVNNYTFVHIKMNDSVKPGTVVEVTHRRIHSHYEMGGMVFLQRIRRKIIDSVYKRLYGEERMVKGREENQELSGLSA